VIADDSGPRIGLRFGHAVKIKIYCNAVTQFIVLKAYIWTDEISHFHHYCDSAITVLDIHVCTGLPVCMV